MAVMTGEECGLNFVKHLNTSFVHVIDEAGPSEPIYLRGTVLELFLLCNTRNSSENYNRNAYNFKKSAMQTRAKVFYQ